MIDLILIFFFAAVFYAGFWAGAKYTTIANFWAEVKRFIKDLF